MGNIISGKTVDGNNFYALEDSGIQLSKAEFLIYSPYDKRDFEILYLKDLKTKEGFERKGYASLLLNKISEEISNRDLVGVLQNTISGSPYKRNLYNRRGWKTLSESLFSWMYLSDKEFDKDGLNRFIINALVGFRI